MKADNAIMKFCLDVCTIVQQSMQTTYDIIVKDLYLVDMLCHYMSGLALVLFYTISARRAFLRYSYKCLQIKFQKISSAR